MCKVRRGRRKVDSRATAGDRKTLKIGRAKSNTTFGYIIAKEPYTHSVS